ncbi:MAG: lysophospholipid acyltransferase family protein [Desulfuromonadaceae bacterium]|nr:lysophospholipid acyltransferase family protein [Desulfuromonadaceae bacterium]MDD2856770.1 lysophospholipid acyltransferase family protein [Desulfuromonadaceae bacterium]
MIRAYLYLSAFIPLTLIFSGSAIISTFIDTSGRLYLWHARAWAKLALALNMVKVSVSGAERLPNGPVIFMSNHQSNFDILAILSAMPRQCYWIAKKELFEIPVFGSSMRRGGYIPLDRGDGRKALQSLAEAASTIHKGKSVIMFPEGTRTQDGNLLPFKRGGFVLARKADVPVVPVTINGSGKINPAGLIRLYSGKIEIILHPPISFPSELRRVEAETWMMESVRDQIESGLVH